MNIVAFYLLRKQGGWGEAQTIIKNNNLFAYAAELLVMESPHERQRWLYDRILLPVPHCK